MAGAEVKEGCEGKVGDGAAGEVRGTFLAAAVCDSFNTAVTDSLTCERSTGVGLAWKGPAQPESNPTNRPIYGKKIFLFFMGSED